MTKESFHPKKSSEYLGEETGGVYRVPATIGEEESANRATAATAQRCHDITSMR